MVDKWLNGTSTVNVCPISSPARFTCILLKSRFRGELKSIGLLKPQQTVKQIAKKLPFFFTKISQSEELGRLHVVFSVQRKYLAF